MRFIYSLFTIAKWEHLRRPHGDRPLMATEDYVFITTEDGQLISYD